MKFLQSETQLSIFKYATCCCLPGVVRRLSCFRGVATHHRIKESTELRSTTYNPGIVAKLMGLDSIPQRINPVHRQQDHSNSSQPVSQTPMFLEIENGKFFIIGLEAGCKVPGKGDSRSDSRRKLLENDGSKKKELLMETSNRASKEGAIVDFELELFDQMVLELVYIF